MADRDEESKGMDTQTEDDVRTLDEGVTPTENTKTATSGAASESGETRADSLLDDDDERGDLVIAEDTNQSQEEIATAEETSDKTPGSNGKNTDSSHVAEEPGSDSTVGAQAASGNGGSRFLEAPHDREIDVPTPKALPGDDFEIDHGKSAKVKPKAKVKRKSNMMPVDDVLKEMWKIPFENGWGREIVFRATTAEGKRVGDVYYFSPEGKKFRSNIEIDRHLLETRSTLSRDCFTFRKTPVFKEPFEIIRNANSKYSNSPSSMDSPDRSSPAETFKQMKKKKTPVSGGGLKIKFAKSTFSPGASKFKSQKSPVKTQAPSPVVTGQQSKTTPVTVKPVKTGNVAKKHTGKRKPIGSLLNGDGKKQKLSIENGQRLCDLTCGQSPPTLHCEVCMCLFHPSCVGFTPSPGAKFVCKGCKGSDHTTNTITQDPNKQVSPKVIAPRPKITATTINAGLGTLIRMGGTKPSIISPIPASSPVIVTPSRQVRPATIISTTVDKPPVPAAQPIRVNIPTSSINPDQISGQLITLPPHVTNKLNLTKPLNLKLNGQTYNIPPKCFIATNEGVKVLLPPGSLPDNVAKGPLSPLAMSASGSSLGGQQLNVRPMVEGGQTENNQGKSSSGVVDLTEDNTTKTTKSPKTMKHSKFMAKSVCHFRKLHTGFDCMIHIFQYLGTTDLLRVQSVCKTWYGVASQSCLWRSLRLKNVIVTDWEAAASYMAKHRTQALDLRMMAHQNDDANRTWHHLHAVLGQLTCLRQIEFSQCPSSILHAVAEKLPNLQLCIAQFIVEQVQDTREMNAKLDLGKFCRLTELECLKLRGVQGLVLPAFSFSGGLQELGSLVKLKTLALTSLRDLPANEFQFLGSLTNLEALEIGDTISWSEETFAQIGKLTKLKNLRLEAGGSLSDEALGLALQELKELSQLELINFVISEKLGESLAKLSWLKIFSVWPNKEEELAPAVNSHLLKATSSMSSLQLVEWGVMNECKSENESFIPLLPTNSSDKEAAGDAEDVSLLTQDVSINELIKRLSTHLPDTKIRVFKVPSALIKKACPSKVSSRSPSPELMEQEAAAAVEAAPVNEAE